MCGSDGLVYKNICEMKRYACLKGLHISQQHLSHCVNTSELSNLILLELYMYHIGTNRIY